MVSAVPRLALALLATAALAACAQHASQSGASSTNGDAAVCDAYSSQRSHVEVVASGRVTRVLGVRGGPSGDHEGYLLRLDGGCALTLKVETNVTLTGPVPLTTGEAVVVKGEYEYNALGGVVHWTHRDPRGNHEAGYVRAGGLTYQ